MKEDAFAKILAKYAVQKVTQGSAPSSLEHKLEDAYESLFGRRESANYIYDHYKSFIDERRIQELVQNNGRTFAVGHLTNQIFPRVIQERRTLERREVRRQEERNETRSSSLNVDASSSQLLSFSKHLSRYSVERANGHPSSNTIKQLEQSYRDIFKEEKSAQAIYNKFANLYAINDKEVSSLVKKEGQSYATSFLTNKFFSNLMQDTAERRKSKQGKFDAQPVIKSILNRFDEFGNSVSRASKYVSESYNSENEKSEEEKPFYPTSAVEETIFHTVSTAKLNNYEQSMLPLYLKYLEKREVVLSTVDTTASVKHKLIEKDIEQVKSQIEDLYSKYFGVRKDSQQVINEYERTLAKKGIDLEGIKEKIKDTVRSSLFQDLNKPSLKPPSESNLNNAIKTTATNIDFTKPIKDKINQSILKTVGKEAFKGSAYSLLNAFRDKLDETSDMNVVNKGIVQTIDAGKFVYRTSMQARIVKNVAQAIKNITTTIVRTALRFFRYFGTAIVKAAALASPYVLVAIVIIGIVAAIVVPIFYGGITHLAADTFLSDTYAYVTKSDVNVSDFIAKTVTYELPTFTPQDLGIKLDDWSEFKDNGTVPLKITSIPMLNTDPNAFIAFLSAVYGDDASYPYIAFRTGEGDNDVTYIDVRNYSGGGQSAYAISPQYHALIEASAPNRTIYYNGAGGEANELNTDKYLYVIKMNFIPVSYLKQIAEDSDFKTALEYAMQEKLKDYAKEEVDVRYTLGYIDSNDPVYTLVYSPSHEADIKNALKKTKQNLKEYWTKQKDTFNKEVDLIIASIKSANEAVNTLLMYTREGGARFQISTASCRVDENTTVTILVCNGLIQGSGKVDYTPYIEAINQLKKNINDQYDNILKAIDRIQDLDTMPKGKSLTVDSVLLSFSDASKQIQAYAKKLYELYFSFKNLLKGFTDILKPTLSYSLPENVSPDCYGNGCCDEPCDETAYTAIIDASKNIISKTIQTMETEIKTVEKRMKEIKEDKARLFYYTMYDGASVSSDYLEYDANNPAIQELLKERKDTIIYLENLHNNVLANFIISHMKDLIPSVVKDQLLKDTKENEREAKYNDIIKSMTLTFLTTYAPYGFTLKQVLWASYLQNATLYHRFGYFFDSYQYAKNVFNASKKFSLVDGKLVFTEQHFRNPSGEPYNDTAGPTSVDPKGYFSTGSSPALFGLVMKGFLDDSNNWIEGKILYKGLVYTNTDEIDAMLDGDMKFDGQHTAEVVVKDKDGTVYSYVTLRGKPSFVSIPSESKVKAEDKIGVSNVIEIVYNEYDMEVKRLLWFVNIEKNLSYRIPNDYFIIEK